MTWAKKTRPNATARIQYGYKANEDDPLVIEPDETLVPLIEEAMDYLDNGYSTRKVAEWLTDKAQRKISHQGVLLVWRANRPDSPRIAALDKANKKRKPKTRKEKAIAAVKRKRSDAKRVQTLMTKKLAAHETKNEISDTLDFGAYEKEPEQREVVFAPNPGPQTEFLAASEQEVLYGGAAGGGKSFGLLADPMRYFHNPNFNGLILRRTNDELRELIWKSQELYPKAFPGAKWAEKKSQWTLPSGAKLWLTYLEREDDVRRYQGLAFSYIAFDELTQHPTPFAWDYMRSRLRTTDPDLPIFMRATTNPGGAGHGWVKQMFIDPAPANHAFVATDLSSGEPLEYPEGHEKAGQPLFKRRFIPASLTDNPYLMEGGQYEANLLSLPENQRRQLLEGDWAVADGAAFPEFRQSIHVVEPFEIPHNWVRFRSADYGYSSWSAVHWYAIDPAFETLIVYRELYLSKHTGKDLGRAVMDAEMGDAIKFGILDSSCWHNRGQIGPSIAEEMITMGCRWRPSDRTAGARVAGKNQLHERLKVDEDTGHPGIIFFNTCRQIIADLPVIPSCPKGSDDIDQRYASDHTYDSLRYGLMSRPRSLSPFDMGRGVPERHYKPSDSTFGY
ncbi:terminase family protein [Planktomarina temperata]|nr:terminase family protein [Planktomarina temperata]